MIEEIEGVFRNAGPEYVNDLRENLQSGNRNATRRTSDSIKSRVIVNGSVVRLEITAKDTWPFTDLGRGPGKWPPRAAIREWVVAKGIEPDSPAADRAAFLISRSIAQKGTIKRPSFVQPVIDKAKTELPTQIRRVLRVTVAASVTRGF